MENKDQLIKDLKARVKRLEHAAARYTTKELEEVLGVPDLLEYLVSVGVMVTGHRGYDLSSALDLMCYQDGLSWPSKDMLWTAMGRELAEVAITVANPALDRITNESNVWLALRGQSYQKRDHGNWLHYRGYRDEIITDGKDAHDMTPPLHKVYKAQWRDRA